MLVTGTTDDGYMFVTGSIIYNYIQPAVPPLRRSSSAAQLSVVLVGYLHWCVCVTWRWSVTAFNLDAYTDGDTSVLVPGHRRVFSLFVA